MLSAPRAALAFLTRLPVGRLEAADFVRAPGWFAAAGLFIGLAQGGVFWLAAMVWPPMLAALVTVAAGLLLTGALHEDGLADTFDGLGSSRPRERALEILRDSRIGAFGALALGVALAGRVMALAALGPLAPAALVAGQALSRAAMTLALRAGPYLRASGAGTGLTGPLGTGVWALIAASVLAVTLGLWALGAALWLGMLALVAAVLILRRWAMARLGGITGDILGACQVAGDLAFLLGVLAWL